MTLLSTAIFLQASISSKSHWTVTRSRSITDVRAWMFCSPQPAACSSLVVRNVSSRSIDLSALLHCWKVQVEIVSCDSQFSTSKQAVPVLELRTHLKLAGPKNPIFGSSWKMTWASSCNISTVNRRTCSTDSRAIFWSDSKTFSTSQVGCCLFVTKVFR